LKILGLKTKHFLGGKWGAETGKGDVRGGGAGDHGGLPRRVLKTQDSRAPQDSRLKTRPDQLPLLRGHWGACPTPSKAPSTHPQASPIEIEYYSIKYT